MNKLLELNSNELELVVQNTSDKLNISAAIIEKELWVCIILQYLFDEFKYKDFIVFKGGQVYQKYIN